LIIKYNGDKSSNQFKKQIDCLSSQKLQRVNKEFKCQLVASELLLTRNELTKNDYQKKQNVSGSMEKLVAGKRLFLDSHYYELAVF